MSIIISFVEKIAKKIAKFCKIILSYKYKIMEQKKYFILLY